MWGTFTSIIYARLKRRFIPTGVGNIAGDWPLSPAIPVHPHGCGEHEWKGNRRFPPSGSSPRVWGTYDRATDGAEDARFIPTGVGNIISRTAQSSTSPVHPHGCGEHLTVSAVAPSSGGSSPRVWGTSCTFCCVVLLMRFIPTGVGNMYSLRDSDRSASVHPHGCGEHPCFRSSSVSASGSSPRVWGTCARKPANESKSRFIPRVWGTCFVKRSHSGPPRFIPTGVGNMRKPCLSRSTAAVHPHGCGEHIVRTIVLSTVCGSSPRVWGTCKGKKGSRPESRFIPTGVGNIRSGNKQCRARAVHPHGCGEHSCGKWRNVPKRGSSPRVWGTFERSDDIADRHRFIPTGVGNILAPKPLMSSHPVHPHGCGEHDLRLQPKQARAGSSPRVWGTLLWPARQVPRHRFIPTGVGNISNSDRVTPRPSVHPHGCGEHGRTDVHLICKGGSSPRVWGTSRRCSVVVAKLRFIPTGVGNILLSQ